MIFLALLIVPTALALPPRVIEVQASTLVLATNTPPGGNLWAGYAFLKRICSVESDYGDPNGEPRQFLSDGSILWGWEGDHIVKRDVGACQINTKVHGAEIARLGLDVVNSYFDNVTYAKILYGRDGWHPWLASKTTKSGGWDPLNQIR